jgi:stage V sporulation protein K
MKEIKDQVEGLVAEAITDKAMAAAGMPVEPRSNNMLLTGNPGTGKTTVTEKMGELMFELGLVKSPKVTKLTRQDLVGEFANQSAENTNKAIKKHRGEVIFIDEAYSLYTGPTDHEGRQVIDELMRLSEEYRNDTSIVLAGYSKEMAKMFEVNPGLKSRFPNHLDLPDYTDEEKAQVLHYIVKTNHRGFSDKGAQKLAGKYASSLPSKGAAGNARAVRNFYDAMRSEHARRIAKNPAGVGQKELATFTRADVVATAARMGLKPPVKAVRTPKPGAATKRQGYQRRIGGTVVAGVRMAGSSGAGGRPGTGTADTDRRRLRSVPA